MIKLVVTDLDGTLLNTKSEISNENFNAIKKLKGFGTIFGIASGRSIASVEKIAIKYNIMQLVDFIIGFNGAKLYDYKMQQEIEAPRLKMSTIRYIINELANTDVSFAVHEENILYASKWSPSIQVEVDLNQYKLVLVENFFEFIAKDYPKLMITAEDDYLTMIEEKIIGKMKYEYNAFRSHENFFEFVAPDVSKGKTLEKYCKTRGISPENVMAFGDNSNDFEMIKYVGVGIAMENSVESLKKIAQKIGRHHDKNGFAYMINDILKF